MNEKLQKVLLKIIVIEIIGLLMPYFPCHSYCPPPPSKRIDPPCTPLEAACAPLATARVINKEMNASPCGTRDAPSQQGECLEVNMILLSDGISIYQQSSAPVSQSSRNAACYITCPHLCCIAD